MSKEYHVLTDVTIGKHEIALVCGSPKQERIATACSLLRSCRDQMDKIIVISDQEFDCQKIQQEQGIYITIDQVFNNVSKAFDFLDSINKTQKTRCCVILEMTDKSIRQNGDYYIPYIYDYFDNISVRVICSIGNPNGLSEDFLSRVNLFLILRDPTIMYYDKWVKFWRTITNEEMDKDTIATINHYWIDSLNIDTEMERNTALVFEKFCPNTVTFYPIYRKPQTECKLITLLNHISPLFVPVALGKLIVQYSDDIEYVPLRL